MISSKSITFRAKITTEVGVLGDIEGSSASLNRPQIDDTNEPGMEAIGIELAKQPGWMASSKFIEHRGNCEAQVADLRGNQSW
jgi:hypothetical protein